VSSTIRRYGQETSSVAHYPTMSYRSTGIRREGDVSLADGEVSLHGVPKPVGLRLKVKGFSPDGMGGARAGFSAIAEINRLDFGLSFNSPMETGGVVLGDHVQISLDIDALLDRSR
jgi:polyisoprenoid-binding protein YceI